MAEREWCYMEVGIDHEGTLRTKKSLIVRCALFPLVVCFELCTLEVVRAQWTSLPMPSPGGGYVLSLAIGQGTIFAGTSEHGVFVSSDAGAHWSAFGLKRDLLKNKRILKIKIKP